MALEKAKIFIPNEDNPLEVMFNPNEYTLESANTYAWKTIPGLSMPIAQFVSGDVSSLTMDLFFDTYEKKEDVRDYTKLIVNLLDVDKDLHAPPICEFVWGTLHFKGILEKVASKYTMFLESGTPVRATLTVTFKAVYSITEQYQHIPRQSADRTKQRTLKQGEQLWHIAAEEYEDPGLWREIARANGIQNPKQLEPGTVIKIPRLYG